MARIQVRLRALGLSLPPPIELPPGIVFPFQFVRILGRRALIAGTAWGIIMGGVLTALEA